MGDVEGMFHQVKVPVCDRDYLRFLWFSDDTDKQPEVYRMTVHLFGGVWSPSCANYALRRTAEDNSGLYGADVVQTVRANFYVDDCLKSLASELEAIDHIQKLCDMLWRGGFRLHKWVSNNRNVLTSIPEEQRSKTVKDVDICGGDLPAERALGVLWDTETDKFGFRINIKDKPYTRRGLLSVIGSVYDPLGLVSPFVLQAKKIFQSETRLRKGWDDQLSPTNIVKWINWIDDLPKLETLKFPRCIIPPNVERAHRYELHHFSDASCEGYGAVSYLKTVTDNGECNCSLLISKSRLAPLKQLTIPRLELLAATISVKLDEMLRRELNLEISRSVFWTDSTIVLQYIRNESRQFHVFVANRVSLIHENSTPDQWRFVESANNPADDVSRGLNAQQMLSSVRWKNGPQFLLQTEKDWPTMSHLNFELSSDDKEVRRSAKMYTTASSSYSDFLDDLFQKYSSWYELKRAVAWLMRLKSILYNKVHGVKLEKQRKTLSVTELNEAEEAIVMVLQRKAYGAELKALEAGKAVSRGSVIHRLEPVCTSKGILCVGGRLQAVRVSTEYKHQMILPRGTHVTTLIVRYFHELSGHSGTETFWIPKGRKTISKVLNQCMNCRKRQRLPNAQRMAVLPSDRVNPGDPPFTCVGLDCFGPFITKRGRSEVKRYGCIFTCLTTRAIHLEKLDGLDTDSFLNGFVRFISRRGCPKMVRSDNGTNFRGADIELRKAVRAWNMKQIHDFMVQKEIDWIFNPPAASHMGGVWERLIRTVRNVMTALLKTSRPLDDDGPHTLLCEVECIVNGRPLTVVSNHHEDAEPLSPNHLLLLRGGAHVPLGDFHVGDTYRKRWKYVQSLADTFWKRWLKEYLPILQLRQKWTKAKRNISVGDIVLILTENCPRKYWPLGRVIETHPGKDGLVRSALVRTSSAVLNRPVDKLCLLEGADND